MERALIKQGGGGYTIYLPKKWVDKKGLKEKECIQVYETDAGLLLTTLSKGKKETTITINEDNKIHIHSLLTYLYRSGFDVITINGINERQLNEIRKKTRDLLLGFELVHSRGDTCTIESIAESTDQKYDTIIRRIFLLLEEGLALLSADYEKGNFSHILEIKESRMQTDKFALYCRRAISKEQVKVNHALSWVLLSFFTHTYHDIDYLYSYAATKKIKPNSQLVKLLVSVRSQAELLYKAYYEHNLSYVHKVQNYRTSMLFGLCIETLEKVKGPDAVIAAYIRELHRMMQTGAGVILTDLIDTTTSTIEKNYSTKDQN